MNIIAFYLPQFHVIPENDEWWGKGFTEWVNVKKAKKLYNGHYQPRIPLNKNYYNLLEIETMQKQVNMAKEYGIYGFCFYHYWFEGKQLLEKPVENYLKNVSLDLPFCLSWANESWTDAWVSNGQKVLLKQTYGEKKSWKAHFDYLLPYFKDDRYIKNDGKPLFVIYRPDNIPCLEEMLSYWQELAVGNGLIGIEFAYQNYYIHFNNKIDKSMFSYGIEYQPGFAQNDLRSKKEHILLFIKHKIVRLIISLFKDFKGRTKKEVMKVQYDKIWERIINSRPDNEKMIPGAFVEWDNTPRKGMNGSVIEGGTPEKFTKYIKAQIINAKINYKKNMMFIFAWNEWAEGGYLEPDERYGYAYLEAIKNALDETGEFPK